ncbi:hypothetical protein J4E08_24120 [Sagittula sp. NFXS13]|uniref:hypothetical protein n=1 Tax=Sagittula sp. NFXS13 TaxID=2819095 RepID=UPI0032DE7F66
MDDIGLVAIILYPSRHPRHNTDCIERFAQQNRARIAGQPLRPRFERQRSVESG